MTPEVSIIVPMYKTPFVLLRRCINSVLKQSFQQFELLVVDDGSGSDYDAFKKEYEEKDPRVHFLTKENGGVASARNYGIEHSQGRYLSFIDSDDYIDEYFIEGLYNAISGCEMSLCGVTEMYYSMEDSLYNARMYFSLPSHFSGLQYLNFSVNKLYLREIIMEHDIRFPLDVKLGEDALFLARYYRYCKYLRCIPDCRYHYCLNTDSAMRSFKPEYWNWETRVIEEDWGLFHQYPLAQREEMALFHWLYEKMMGAANYYYDYEYDPVKLDGHLQAILDNEIIRKLLSADLSVDTEHFTKEEKKRVRVIAQKGIRGLRKYIHKRAAD